MQPTDFSKYLTSFLTKYLSHEEEQVPTPLHLTETPLFY